MSRIIEDIWILKVNETIPRVRTQQRGTCGLEGIGMGKEMLNHVVLFVCPPACVWVVCFVSLLYLLFVCLFFSVWSCYCARNCLSSGISKWFFSHFTGV